MRLQIVLLSFVLGAGLAQASDQAPAPAAPLASPERGPAGAKHVIVEYTDFGCPYCAKGAKTLDELREKYGADLRIVFKPVPLKIATYAEARMASQYFLAATLQSMEKAWRLHDMMFANQSLIGDKYFYIKAAKVLGLDLSRLKADAEGDAVKGRLATDLDDFHRRGFTGVPVFMIGETVIMGASPIETFNAALNDGGAAPEQRADEKPAAAHAWYDEPSKTGSKETK